MESSQGRNIERRYFFIVIRKPIAEFKKQKSNTREYTALATARTFPATA